MLAFWRVGQTEWVASGGAGGRISKVKVSFELVEASQRNKVERHACVKLGVRTGVLGLWCALLVISGMLTDRN